MKPYNSLRIRPKSEPKPSRWAWLNTPFLLWFLSFVVLSLFTLFFTHWQAVESNFIAGMRVESSILVRRTIAREDLLTFCSEKTTTDNISERKDTLKSIVNALINGTPATRLYPEFEGVSILGLLFQQRSLVERSLVEGTIDIDGAVQFARLEGRVMNASNPVEVDQMAQFLADSMDKVLGLYWLQDDKANPVRCL